MKEFLLLLMSLMSLCGSGQTVYPSGVSGCIARWTFDVPEGASLATIQDWSGNNNHGTNNAITSVAGWKGGQFLAGKFNGTSSFSRVSANPIFNVNNISILALVKFDRFYDGTCQGNNIIYQGFNYNSNLNWALYTTDGNYDHSCNTFSPNFNKANFTTPTFVNTTIPMTNFIDSSKWYLIGCTFNESVINYYQIAMDSSNKLNTIIPSYSVSNTNPIGSGNFDIFMGATQNAPFPYWFNGKMDEVVLFNKALTNAEVQSVYDYLFGYPTSIISVDGASHLDVYCANKHVYISGMPSKSKNIAVLDINGKIIRELKNVLVNEVDLSDIPNQMVLVKYLMEPVTFHTTNFY
ncbi:MAG: hypothetical protein IPJ31_01090 [Bacteroidetes bacterium]|nr:hypothetical protein [Bacteroidota bacterium]